MPLCKRKLLFICLLLLCFSSIVHTQANQPRKKVGLVLGGGGAKGAAEVGVLKVLEEAGIPIDYIAGTSIGAIVGGLYAVGYNAADIDSLYRSQDWLFLFSDRVKREFETFLSKEEREKYVIRIPFSKERKVSLPTGYFKGQNVVNLLTKLTVGYHNVSDFSTLPIPFRCVAVDLVDGKEVVLSSGSLPMAMRSSMSIPGVFAPVELNDMMLVDGGAINNLPVDVVKEMGADIVICVDLSNGLKTKEELNSASSVVEQLISIMGQAKYLENKSMADIYINPSLKEYHSASFQAESIDTMLLRGEQAARQKWDELIFLRQQIYADGCDSVDVYAKPRKLACTDGYYIEHIKIEGIDGEEKKWIRKKIALQEHSCVSPEEIDRTLAMLQGLNIFSRVEYRLTNKEPFDLVFVLEPKEYRYINIGARFDTDDLASLIASVSNNQQFSTRHHYALTGRISRNLYFETKYTFGHLFGAKIGFSYRFAHHDFNLYADKRKLDAVEFLSHSLTSFYTHDIGNIRLKTGACFEYYHYHSDMFKRDGGRLSHSSDHFLNYFASIKVDSYDRRCFPSRGGCVYVLGAIHTDDGIKYDERNPFGEVVFRTECALRLTPIFYLIPKLKGRFLFGEKTPALYQNYVGGIFDANYLPWQMAWETSQHTHLLERNIIMGQLAFRYRLKSKFYLTALSEYGKEAHNTTEIFSGKNFWGFALRASYDFVFGPISIQTNYSNLWKNVGVYVNAGFVF